MKSYINGLSSKDAMKPAYADEIKREENKRLEEKEREIAELRKEADRLFDSQQWKAAQPVFKKLAQELPNDWTSQLKAGCCFTFGPVDADVKEGEAFLKKCIELSPVFPNGYGVLAHNMMRQQRYNEVVPLVQKMVACPVQDDNSDSIVNAIKTARDVLIKLNRTKELIPLVEEAKKKYSKWSEKLDEVVSGIESAELWEKGKEFINNPKKDFVYGQQLFLRLATLKPDDYWATLLSGGCLTWGGKAKEGESWIKKAIQIDSSIPNGYSLLAQNLLMQGKSKEVISTVEEMLTVYFKTVVDSQDHADKIIEGLDCAFKVLGRGPAFNALVGVARAKYPNLSPRLDAM